MLQPFPFRPFCSACKAHRVCAQRSVEGTVSFVIPTEPGTAQGRRIIGTPVRTIQRFARSQYGFPRYLLYQHEPAFAIAEDEGLTTATDLACNHASLSIQFYPGADHFNLVTRSEAQFLACHDPHRSEVHL